MVVKKENLFKDNFFKWFKSHDVESIDNFEIEGWSRIISDSLKQIL